MEIILKSIGFLFVVFYFGLGVLLFVMQHNFIYFPSKAVPHGYDEIEFIVQGESIKSIRLNPGKPDAIMYFGGNAEAVALNAADFAKHFPAFTIYLINYRGYGGSSGAPYEAALYADALFIFDQLSGQHASIAIIGRSLGSGVATYLGAQRDVAKLVLVTPFDSIQAMAQKSYPLYPMSLLLTDKYLSSARAKNIKAQVLVVIAEHDQVVGRAHTKKLIEAFVDNPPTVVIINESDHNNLAGYPGYYQSIAEFLSFHHD